MIKLLLIALLVLTPTISYAAKAYDEQYIAELKKKTALPQPPKDHSPKQPKKHHCHKG